MNNANLDILRIIWESGVVVKSVLFILILASIISWAVVLKKIKQLKKIELNNMEFFNNYAGSKKLKEIVLTTEHFSFTPFREVFLEGYNELIKLRQNFMKENKHLAMKEHFKDYGLDIIVRAMQKGVIESNLRMQSYLSLLASIGSISPFIGLFGTVWGIIDSFSGLASGSATLDVVAPGIAEALVATAVGLGAAIPAVWFFYYFNNRVDKINSEIKKFEQDFLNLIERTMVADKEN